MLDHIEGDDRHRVVHKHVVGKAAGLGVVRGPRAQKAPDRDEVAHAQLLQDSEGLAVRLDVKVTAHHQTVAGLYHGSHELCQAVRLLEPLGRVHLPARVAQPVYLGDGNRGVLREVVDAHRVGRAGAGVVAVGHCQRKQSKPNLIALPYARPGTGSVFLGSWPRQVTGGGPTVRSWILPSQLLLKVPWGRIWTCPAWCELREGFRVFRVDRIESCQDSGDTFALIPGRTYGDYLETLRIPKDEAR